MAEYDEIVPSGTIYLDEGETYENKLIDLSGGDDFTMIVRGGNTTIRNVGFKGLFRGTNFIFSITANGPVEFDNIYMGDGANKDGEDFQHGPGGVFYHKSASGDVTFNRMNVQGFPNNGFYCSNTPSGGTVHWYRCYAKNNGVTSYRCADPGDLIEESVGLNDNTDYGPGWGGYSEEDGRPVWVWAPGGCNIVDSHFAAGSYPQAFVVDRGRGANMEGGAYSGAVYGTLNETNVGRNPDLSVPEGCPTSPEEAASGGSESPPDPEPPEEPDHDWQARWDDVTGDYDEYMFIGDRGADSPEYVLEGENIRQVDRLDATWNGDADMSDDQSRVSGTPSGAGDAYVIDGVSGFSVDPVPQNIWYEDGDGGRYVEPDEFDEPGEEEPPDDEDPPDDKDERIDELEEQVAELEDENDALKTQLDDALSEAETAEESAGSLRDRLSGLTDSLRRE